MVVCQKRRQSVGSSVGINVAKLHKLTDLACQRAKAGKHGDGGRLTLVVQASGAKSWLWYFQLNGRPRREMGFGGYPAVSLADARQKAADARKLLAAGIDPIEARDASKTAAKPLPTFGSVAALVIADAQAKTDSEKVKYQWARHLGPALCGDLLERAVHEITAPEVARTLALVWRSKPEVARKLYPAIRRVFDRARVILRDEHGIDLKALGFETPAELTRGHYPSLPYGEMPDFMTALREHDTLSARALELLILTNLRTDAVRQATFDQFDLNAGLWVVPLSSLKDRRHRAESLRVPLAPRSVEIVREMDAVRTSAFVFAGEGRTSTFSENMLQKLLVRMNSGARKWLDEDGRRAVPHGFRATFKTWAKEVATVPSAVIEHAMGHRVGGKVERSYNRGDLLQKRAVLMTAWANYCEPPTGGDVIQLRPNKSA
jgi:integrase